MTNLEVLNKLIQNDEVTKADTVYSRKIFKEYEEGKQDHEIMSGMLKEYRRDWLVLADIYNNGRYTQKFHLYIYLQFKLKNKKIANFK